jgi:hypothetical protein
MECVMFFVSVLMVGAWVVTLSMIGVCALNESGKLLKIRRHLALWLDASAVASARAEQSLGRSVIDAR